MTAATIAGAVPQAGRQGEGRKLMAFVAMIFGMFMALLDIQIVSASLAEIQAGLSASADEISWVQTSYLIAEVVMIPLSGFLARVLSTRWLFAASAAGFTVASLLCGLSTSIEEMIVFRALQGFIGGAMIPSVFAAAFTIFPPNRRAAVQPIIGLIATLAPTIGPTVGGYLTDTLSWHWLFFINVVPGIFVVIVTWRLIDFDKPDLALFKRFDWWGLLFMALFLCSLEYVLEEGPIKDWFDEDLITIFAVVSAVGAIAFFARVLVARTPIVDMSAFTNRNFATGCLFSFTLGIGLYGLTYLYPAYLGRIRGYNSLMIGETMFISGLCMLLAAPVAGRLAQKLDQRLMLLLGFLGFAAGTLLMVPVTRDWDFNELLWPQILRGVSLMFCIIPINNLALGTLTPAQVKGGSGLYNLMRNLGGAVGLAAINTLLNNRFDLHIARLHETVTWANARAVAWLDAVQHRMGSLASPDLSALKQLAQMVRGQAYVMAFSDVFAAVTVAFLLMVPLLVIVRRPAGGAAGEAH